MDRAYRQNIKIQTPVYGPEDNYGQKPITGYSDVLNCRARWMHTGGSETFRGRQIQADIVGVFEIRYHQRVNVDSSMSVLWDGKRYEIYSARPSECKTEGGFKTIEIFVKAIE